MLVKEFGAVGGGGAGGCGVGGGEAVDGEGEEDGEEDICGDEAYPGEGAAVGGVFHLVGSIHVLADNLLILLAALYPERYALSPTMHTHAARAIGFALDIAKACAYCRIMHGSRYMIVRVYLREDEIVSVLANYVF